MDKSNFISIGLLPQASIIRDYGVTVLSNHVERELIILPNLVRLLSAEEAEFLSQLDLQW